MTAVSYKPGAFEEPLDAQERVETTEREAKIQRMAEMIYAAEFVRTYSFSNFQAAVFAKIRADKWARSARSGLCKLPEFKP